MKTVTKQQFRKILVSNKISIKNNLNIGDYLKGILLKKPYLHLIWKQIEPLVVSMQEPAFMKLVDFSVAQGFPSEYVGDKGKYAFDFLSFVLKKYCILDTDNKKEVDSKINFLWNVYQRLCQNIEFNAKDKGIDYVSKVVVALLDETKKYIFEE